MLLDGMRLFESGGLNGPNVAVHISDLIDLSQRNLKSLEPSFAKAVVLP